MNGRKEYNRLVITLLAGAGSVLLLAGAGWVGAIQGQVNSAQTINAQLSVSLAKLETRFDYISRENADLRIKMNELERTLAAGRGGGH